MTRRFDYVEYDDMSKSLQAAAKNAFINLDTFITDNLSFSTNVGNAIKSLEEAYMWIGKAIRDDQIIRDVRTKLQEQRNNS